jgi:hypothetical protein
MTKVSYANGDEVRIGDVVDVGGGNGPRMRVVVIIPASEAAEGFNASDWAYLKRGIILEDTKVFGLLHVDELDHELVFIQRAAG